MASSASATSSSVPYSASASASAAASSGSCFEVSPPRDLYMITQIGYPLSAIPVITTATLSCSDTITLVAAKYLFGEIAGGKVSKSNVKCPKCYKVVTSYCANTSASSNAVENLLGVKRDGCMEDRLVIHIQGGLKGNLLYRPVTEIPFPGIRTCFGTAWGDWTERGAEYFCRLLTGFVE